MKSENDYLLGSSDAELERLSKQHRTWQPEAMALWKRAGIKAGDTVLDFGCGPGFATVDLAEMVGPTGKVIAFDLSRKFLDHVDKLAAARRLKQIETVEGTAETLSLPVKVGHIYSRWVFCFLPQPEAVLKRLAGMLTPGGNLALNDYFSIDYVLYPPSLAYTRVLEAIGQSWAATGGNLEIQQAMPGMLTRAGFRVRETTPISRIARPGDAYWNWPKDFYTLFVPELVKRGLLSPREADAFWDVWKTREADPSALLKTPTFLDIIATPA